MWARKGPRGACPRHTEREPIEATMISQIKPSRYFPKHGISCAWVANDLLDVSCFTTSAVLSLFPDWWTSQRELQQTSIAVRHAISLEVQDLEDASEGDVALYDDDRCTVAAGPCPGRGFRKKEKEKWHSLSAVSFNAYQPCASWSNRVLFCLLDDKDSIPHHASGFVAHQNSVCKSFRIIELKKRKKRK
jgi:hypothetical protein